MVHNLWKTSKTSHLISYSIEINHQNIQWIESKIDKKDTEFAKWLKCLGLLKLVNKRDSGVICPETMFYKIQHDTIGKDL